MYLLLTLVLSFGIAAAQQIVDKTSFSVGEQFTVTCSIVQFTGNLPSITTSPYLILLNMQRKLSTDTHFFDIASYNPFLPGNDSTTRYIPKDKSWDIKFTGGGSTTNRNTIKIVMVSNNSACNDAGLYRCFAMFYNDAAGNPYTTSEFNLTASAGITQNDIVMTPHIEQEGGDVYTSYNQVGQNVTMTCSYKGPLNLVTLWRYSTSTSNEVNYPYTNDITESTPQIDSSSSGCTVYLYTSTLTFQYQEFNADGGNTYYCIVQYNGERSRRNFTINTASETPTDGASSGTAETNVGAIVGGVIGGVVLLVLVIVLVYFFVIRKRKSGSDEDKHKNVETTDNGKDNFSPPPVFYSKPHKPPKDESDGSRPVGMTNDALDISYDSKDLKGPPQYTNTVDDYEPPGYEKETHRGRANKAYEEEKEEKKEGHRSRRHRDREEKEPEDKDRRDDRRSRHRDRGEAEPKVRNYSTEDGTDDRYIGYGDPNMGTSI